MFVVVVVCIQLRMLLTFVVTLYYLLHLKIVVYVLAVMATVAADVVVAIALVATADMLVICCWLLLPHACALFCHQQPTPRR